MVDDIEVVKQTPFLTFTKLAEISLGLLTSSSIERYALVAEAAAQELIAAVTSVNGKWNIILDRAKLLWGMSISSSERLATEAELAELAVLVTALIHQRTEVAGMTDFVAAVGNYVSPATAWVSGLVRHLNSSIN